MVIFLTRYTVPVLSRATCSAVYIGTWRNLLAVTDYRRTDKRLLALELSRSLVAVREHSTYNINKSRASQAPPFVPGPRNFSMDAKEVVKFEVESNNPGQSSPCAGGEDEPGTSTGAEDAHRVAGSFAESVVTAELDKGVGLKEDAYSSRGYTSEVFKIELDNLPAWIGYKVKLLQIIHHI